MIYSILLIPVLAAILLYVFFKRQMAWFEFFIPLVVGLVIIFVAKASYEASATADVEYLGFYVTSAEYYEDWDEKVSCRHPIYRTETDAEGNSHEVFEGYEHLYDVDYHPPRWEMITNGNTLGISEKHYRFLTQRFGNEKKVDLHRNYHSNDGDKFVTMYDNSPERFEGVTVEHTYVNKVQASNSIFRQEQRRLLPAKDSTAGQLGLYEYPRPDGFFKQQCIWGIGDTTQPEAEHLVQMLNGFLGVPRQLRVFVLMFHNKPLEHALLQEAYFGGGNKNEFIVQIGLTDSNHVQWAHVTSWTQSDQLRVSTEKYLIDQDTLCLTGFVRWLGPEIKQRWVRKQFKDFDYLEIETPGWVVVVAALLVLVTTIGISVWAIKNDISS